jgi:hypothetical protein
MGTLRYHPMVAMRFTLSQHHLTVELCLATSTNARKWAICPNHKLRTPVMGVMTRSLPQTHSKKGLLGRKGMLRVFVAVPVTLVFLAMKGFFLHGLLTKVRKRARALSDGLNHLLMMIFLI